MRFRLCLLLVFLTVLSACDISRQNAKYLDSQIEDPNFDIHEVEYSTTPKRFNVASYSHINRSSGERIDKLTDVKQVAGGAYGSWSWAIYADRQAYYFTSRLVRRESVTINGNDGPRLLTIPTWDDAFREFAKTAATVFGASNLPLEVRMTIVGQQSNFSTFVVHEDDQHLILDYYFALDESIKPGTTGAFQWLADTVGTAGHEFSHAFIYEQDIRLPDSLTNEVMAYTMEQCVKLAVVGSQAGMAYLDKGGKEIEPTSLDFAKVIHTNRSASLNAYYLAEYNTVHFLSTSAIDRRDVSMKDKLMGLCIEQYRHVNDFEKSFYPVDLVQPFDFEWNDYQSQ